MSFTHDLWQRSKALQDLIREMPFNAELAAGTLPAEVFQGYIIQDAHYLEGFARALALTAARAPESDDVAQFAMFAHGAIAGERQLHDHYMALFGISRDDFANAEISCACDHYVSFLLRTATSGDFGAAVAALLPCFWIYREVGRHVAATAQDDNPYRPWIETYSSESFSESVDLMIALTDRVAAEADSSRRESMHRAFARSSWHEWNFWDSAYHQRSWTGPIAISAE